MAYLGIIIICSHFVIPYAILGVVGEGGLVWSDDGCCDREVTKDERLSTGG